MQYYHHNKNYKISLQEELIPTDLKLKKDPAFLPVTVRIQQNWNSILFNCERNSVGLLLIESDSVIAKLKLDFNKELKKTISRFDKGKEIVI